VGVEVRAFGGLEIVGGSTGIRVGSRQRQVLLSLLVLHRGRVVPVSTLADRMWPAGQLDAAVVASRVRVHLHRLRHALGEPGAVRHQPPGYALAMASDRIDVHRFEELVRQGRAAGGRGDHAAAADLLRQALTLCRGPAFQGLEDVEELALEARRLAELRLAAQAERIAAELALGEHAGLVAELQALVAEHPLRERFRAQLMTALHRAGRRADALAAYHAGRQILVEELGVEPGEECRELFRRILVGGPVDEAAHPRPVGEAARPDPVAARSAEPPVPRQLPAGVAGFAGRVRQLRELDAALSATGPVPIAAVDGMAGAGKTALAVHWAHRVAHRFPDGQLYADLRGYAAGPALPPERVLGQFLGDLGEPAGQVPAELDRASARYRSLLAGRRMLVLLDNAAGADQVRPLLPGGRGCLVLVTSRDQLAGLVARDGARRVAVDVLAPAESVELLAGVLGADRVAAEPEVVAELAELCGHLPLALRIAAAGLATHPARPIAWYAAQLRDGDRLATLVPAGDEPAAVAASFGLSYRRLAPPVRRMFRLLGLPPGPELTAAVAAALAGTSPELAERWLEALAGAHLVDERVAGRYSCHDLVRRYAASQAEAEDPAPDRAAALARLQEHYLRTTAVAVQLRYPHTLRLPAVRELAADPGSGSGQFTGPAGALAWLVAERANLAALLLAAAAGGAHRTAWLLADALRDFLVQAMPAADGLALARAGLVAARAGGDPPGQASALISLAGLEVRRGRSGPAAELAGRARAELAGRARAELAGRARAELAGRDWPDGRGVALSMLGTVAVQHGEPDRAVEHYRAALAAFERTGWRHGQAGVVGNLGLVLHDLGRLVPAARYAAQAAGVFAEIGSPSGEAISLANLGDLHHLLGRFDRALDCYHRAADGYRAVGDESEVGRALQGQALVHADAGRPEEALPLAESALRLASAGQNPGLEPYCLVALATVQLRLGQPAAATGTWQRAAELAQATSDRYSVAVTMIGLAGAHQQAGRAAAARALVERALALSRRAGYRLLEGLALAAGAAARLADGEPAGAAPLAEQAVAIHRETGHRLGEVRARLLLGRARQATGDLPASRAHWRRARALADRIGAPEAGEAAALLAG
jgi:DNA-binding SARP family transcriptional activator